MKDMDGHEGMNVDPHELEKFERIASRWWDPEGEFRPLHQLNPLRTAYVAERVALAGSRVLDIGCGGGLLSEALAAEGAEVMGIDLSPGAISVARLHLHESGLRVDYQEIAAETLAERAAGSFDLVTCMELLEHVPDPAALVAACGTLVRPGGDVFFSTLNRNAKSWLMAVVGAEYIMGLLPRGTHDYARFIRPSELTAWARPAGLDVQDITGMSYDPLARNFALSGDVDVNYLCHFRRREA